MKWLQIHGLKIQQVTKLTNQKSYREGITMTFVLIKYAFYKNASLKMEEVQRLTLH